MNQIWWRSCISLVIVTVVASSAWGIVVDDFDSGAGVVRSELGSPGPSNFTAPGAIGGSRTLEILGFPTDADPLSVGAVLEIRPGLAGHSQAALSPGGRSRIRWDANGASLGGEDFTEGGTQDALGFEVIALDQGSASVIFTVESGLESASATMEITGAGSPRMRFAEFSGYAPRIFENVDAIVMEIVASQELDMIFDMVQTFAPVAPGTGTPEPVSLAMGLMGLTALWTTTSRRGGRS